MRTEHPFVRLDDFDFDEFLQHALPALERIDPIGLLRLLSEKLYRAAKVSAPEDEHSYPGRTSMWVRDLDHPDAIDGALAQLARAVSRVAIGAATTKDNAEQVFAILERHDHEIFRRIRLRVLASAGQYVRDRVDSFFIDRGSVEPPLRGREVAAVVREQFVNASEDAQRSFISALESGPLRYLADEDGGSSEAKAEELAGWQRRRLLWFRERVPDALQEMATKLAVVAQRHSPEDEGLAEDGFHIGGGFVGTQSPISVDELRRLAVDAFVDYVVTWRPDPSGFAPRTREELDRVLQEYATQNPTDAVVRVQRLGPRLENADGRVAAHAHALLTGLRKAVEGGTAIDWPATIQTLLEWWPHIEAQLDREEARPGWRPWRWLATEVTDLLIAASRNNAIPSAFVDTVWTLIELVMKSPHTWESVDSEPFEDFEDVMSAALNNAAGRVTEAALELAFAEFRANLDVPEHEANSEQIATAAAPVVARLRPLIEHVLAQTGRPAIAARATVGMYIPALHVIDREWVLHSASRLFERGMTNPLESPVWGAYITRNSLFDNIFSDLRGWYVQAATDMPLGADETGDREQWSVTQHLAEHVFGALMHGLITLDGDDRLMSTVFERLPAGERAHISWQVFRAWTDARRPVRQLVVERLLRFWKWRLDKLEASPVSDARQQDLSGLTWLICAPYLPDGEVLELGLRTLTLANGEAAARGAIWVRLAALAAVDVDRAFAMAELLIRGALERPYPYINIKETEPVLSRAVADGTPKTREAATRLIHLLGEKGHIEFGRLLRPD
jgi:hypothetical protein